MLTTPAGADAPAPALVEGFPLLVRLHRDFFDFTQTQPHGEDIRLSAITGEPLMRYRRSIVHSDRRLVTSF